MQQKSLLLLISKIEKNKNKNKKNKKLESLKETLSFSLNSYVFKKLDLINGNKF